MAKRRQFELSITQVIALVRAMQIVPLEQRNKAWEQAYSALIVQAQWEWGQKWLDEWNHMLKSFEAEGLSS